MQFIKLVLCILILVTKTCFAGLIDNTSEVNKWRLVDAAIDILESCYADRFTTVGLAGPSAGVIMKKISLRDTPIAVAMIKPSEPSWFDLASRYKLQVFVITTTNETALNETHSQIKNSKWWNHMASFILIDFDVKNGCYKAFPMLFQAWRLNMLNSKFLCFYGWQGPIIYTFNPYTNKAPVPWLHAFTSKLTDGRDWTLFVRQYRQDESRCDKLDFDKTVELNGFPIRTCNSDNPATLTLIDRGSISTSLNATWLHFLQPSNPTTVDFDTGLMYGAYPDVFYGRCDVRLDSVINHILVGQEYTDTFYPVQIAILTQYPRYRSQLDKLASVLDISSRFGVLLVMMFTLWFLKYWLREPLMTAILELVLLVCNAGLQRVPRETAPRIYLAGLFIFVVTIQGIYSGQLAALLTKDVRLPTVDTIEDLARSKHTIYGYWHLQIFFNRSEFKGRFVSLHDEDCPDYVINSSTAACISSRDSLYVVAAENNLHISRENVGVNWGSFIIRPDWPLQERMNVVLGQLSASGTHEYVYKMMLSRATRMIESYENQEYEADVKVLTLDQLTFAFVILGIGLACATVTFIIEVATFDTAIARPRKRPRRVIKFLK